jgi:hypothetical protein
VIARISCAILAGIMGAMLLSANAPAAAQSAPAESSPAEAATAEPEQVEELSADDVRQEIVGLPLCGTPESGPLMGKPLCTVLLPDGNAAVAGAGILIRGMWEMEGDKICRRSADDPPERRRCVSYSRLQPGRYRNSDGVESCIGPCP